MGNDDTPIITSGGARLLSVVVAVAVLYFARLVLIPLALAMLLAFMVAPLLVRFRRWGFSPLWAMVASVALSSILIVAATAFMTLQLSDLGRRLPEYQVNVEQKLDRIRHSSGGVMNRVSHAIHRFTDRITPPEPQPADARVGEEKPVPVEVRRAPFSPFEVGQKLLGSVVHVTLIGGIVIVLVVFILLQREDLRDRVIRLFGARQIHLTTRVLDDAAHRVSRFLLAQLALNTGYGVLAGIGLHLLGVPNPMLWGLLAILLRYIPYLGIWLAALMPAALAFAVEPGWSGALLVFALYFGLDLTFYNLAEPFLYGTSTGLSPLAVVIAAVFWTWLWGPVGLLLATPLTVCVVVLGRHVPSLQFLSVLLSDEPVLPPAARFYQRMLALDFEEAAEIAEKSLKHKPLAETYDEVVLPALAMMEEDRHRGRLDESQQELIFENARMLVEDLAQRADEGANPGRDAGAAEARNPVLADSAAPPVMCIPARDEADEIAAAMIGEILERRGINARVLSSEYLAGEAVDHLDREKAVVACVAAVPPLGYMHARYLCRRLRGVFPNLKLVGAVFAEPGGEDLRQRHPPIPADELASSLCEAVNAVVNLVAIGPAAAPPEAAHAR